jgi:iron complex outermembrane recepter protein
MRLSVAVALCALSSICLAADPARASIRKSTSIPAESLGAALQTLASTYDFQVLYRTETVKDLKTRGATGTFTPQEALGAVLAGTGLAYKYVDEKTVTIIPTSTATASQGSAPQADSQKEDGKNSSQNFLVAQVDQEKTTGNGSLGESDQVPKKADQREDQLQEVVVTGTLIHNVAPITPVLAITQSDLVNQGYTTLAEAMFDLPQNFQGGGTSPSSNNISGAGGSGAVNNFTFASGINLRGLGGNSTLVLLNGRRLAPTAFGGTVDISQLPISVIDRVEILTDGASALYGSDAVAGVVNIITKQDYSGFEIGGRSSDIAQGKTPGYGGDVVGGNSWGSGGFVASADYQKDNSLFARNRSFSETLDNPWALTPENEAVHLYGSIHQSLTDKLTFLTDVLFTHRDYEASAALFGGPIPFVSDGVAKQYSISPELDYAISPSWTATLIGQWSKERDLNSGALPTPYSAYSSGTTADYQVNSLEPRVDGKLLSLPGGAVSLAVGGQVREEKFDNTVYPIDGGVVPTHSQEVSRHVTSSYGELMIPIFGRDNSLPFVKELRVDLSGRYDHYSDFGSTKNPKFGLSWTPMNDLTLHGTYARSFQAPTLVDLIPLPSQSVTPAADPNSPSGSSLALIEEATGNPSLQPQIANTFNTGFTYQPSALPNFRLEASYFHINFDDEIITLGEEGYCAVALYCTLQDEAALGPYFQRNPSLAQVEALLNNPDNPLSNYAGGNYTPAPYTPSDIKAIGNLGIVNAASTRIRGVDLTPRYLGAETPYGRFHADLNASYFIKYEQNVTPASPIRTIDNTFGNPLRFRAKANLGWDKNGWAANARVNFANAYTNTASPTCPDSCQPISSWTTVDLGLSYAVPATLDIPWLSGIRFAVIVNNVFNRYPPVANTVSPNYGYDVINANPLLRSFSLTFTKHFGGGVSR